MRIGIAGLLHESNTFAGTATELRHFEEAFLHTGADLLPAWKDAHHELGGFIEGCSEVEAVPLMAAWATPSGPLTEETYESLVSRLLNEIQNARPLDGVLLALHGSMGAAHQPDADGETIERVRDAIGNTPLVVTLDMHANVSQRMVDAADAIIAYRTYPHIDQRQRGLDAANAIKAMVRGETPCHMAHRKLPLLIHIVQQFTTSGPMADIIAELERLESSPHVQSVSVLPGYIYADVADLGVSVIVLADNQTHADETTDAFAKYIFERREALNADLPNIETAVAEALRTEGTVCLMDGGDNIGAGGPGDSTLILHELRKQGGGNVLSVIYDPAAVEQCTEAGEGARIKVNIGGKTDTNHGAPFTIEGNVQLLADGRFTETEARHGGMREQTQGATAVVVTDDGFTIVLNSLRIMPTSLAQLTSLNIDPTAYKIITVKGVTAPRAAYDPIATKCIAVDSPGITSAGPETFTYKHRPHPLYPLDEVS